MDMCGMGPILCVMKIVVNLIPFKSALVYLKVMYGYNPTWEHILTLYGTYQKQMASVTQNRCKQQVLTLGHCLILLSSALSQVDGKPPGMSLNYSQ